MATQGDAAYEARQAEIKAKYADVLAKKAWLETTGQTFINAVWPFSSFFRNWAGNILRHISIVVDPLAKLTDVEYNFPPMSERDAQKWSLIQTKAEELKTLLGDLRRDGSDVLTRGANTPPERELGGRTYPNRIPTYGWDSTAGVNYRSQIQFQENAADYCITLAVRTGGFIKTAGVDFRIFLQAILNLLIAILEAIAGLFMALLAAMIATKAVNPLAAMVSLGFGVVATVTIVGMVRAASNYFTAVEALKADAEPTMTSLAGYIARTSPFRPYNTWPDPTKDTEFPHMVRGPDGRWTVNTLPQDHEPRQ